MFGNLIIICVGAILLYLSYVILVGAGYLLVSLVESKQYAKDMPSPLLAMLACGALWASAALVSLSYWVGSTFLLLI